MSTTFKPEHIRKYYEARLPGRNFGSGRKQVSGKCPFHEDKKASFTINMEKGIWHCFSGCGGDDLVGFEMRFTSCDRDTAKANIMEVLGDRQIFAFSAPPEAIYRYESAAGTVKFEKVRYPGKRFVQRRPKLEGGYEYKTLEGIKPLYHLPEVLTANELIICEGEKDVDRVRALKLDDRERKHFVAVTCNFDGAGRWREEYNGYFVGKKVFILPDNDAIGRRHAEQIARALYPHALVVKIVKLPGLPEKGDVSDYLNAGHSREDLIAEIVRASIWRPGPEADRLLIPASEFISDVTVEVDWLVEGVIERGANGFICGEPKASKSWVAVDLALAISAGRPWLEFAVPAAARVALISREDNPALTAWRVRHLAAPSADIERGNLYVNTRRQSPEFKLDNPELWQAIVDSLIGRRIEFAIFDVFNVMHLADENDNTEMRAVLQKLTELQAAVGCGIGVVHHLNKGDGSLTKRLRGASAIAGWAEWLIAVRMADEDTKVRHMQFELKAAESPDDLHYHIDTEEEGSRIRRVPGPEGSAGEGWHGHGRRSTKASMQ